DALSGDGNSFHGTPWDSGTPGYLPTVGCDTKANRRASATGFNNSVDLCLKSAARLEDRVDLGALLDDLPGTGEAGGNHEGIARTEAAALAAGALYDDPSGGHDAQLVLGVAHAPFAARRRPAPGEELLAAVDEIVAHLQFWRARDQAVRGRLGDL